MGRVSKKMRHQMARHDAKKKSTSRIIERSKARIGAIIEREFVRVGGKA